MAEPLIDAPALFVPDGDRLLPTPLTRGPWDPGFLHGGAVCGLLGWALEQAGGAGELVPTRMSVEIHAMVPLAPLEVTTTVTKPGRRSRVVEAAVGHDGRRLARAASQWVAPVSGERPDVPAAAEVPPRPAEAARPWESADFDYPRPGFNCDAVELRSVEGSTETAGPGMIWARVRQPVVAGTELSGWQRAAVLSDFAIAVGWEDSPSGQAFINPDVTLQLLRPPAGEWVLLESRVTATPGGGAWCRAQLFDDAGLCGIVLESLVETPATFRS